MYTTTNATDEELQADAFSHLLNFQGSLLWKKDPQFCIKERVRNREITQKTVYAW